MVKHINIISNSIYNNTSNGNINIVILNTMNKINWSEMPFDNCQFTDTIDHCTFEYFSFFNPKTPKDMIFTRGKKEGTIIKETPIFRNPGTTFVDKIETRLRRANGRKACVEFGYDVKDSDLKSIQVETMGSQFVLFVFMSFINIIFN